VEEAAGRPDFNRKAEETTGTGRSKRRRGGGRLMGRRFCGRDLGVGGFWLAIDNIDVAVP
jgi:hypothetical protein